MEQILFIKNMVCDRCISAVKKVLQEANIAYQDITLGEVSLKNQPNESQLKQLQTNLTQLGFELIDNRKSQIINKVKTLIIEEVFKNANRKKEGENYSSFLEKEIAMDYSNLSSLFSSIEGRTIESYIISQKIERVKELLVYDQLTLSEIAWEMRYSSIQHLSRQFKKVTGLTPSHFREIGSKKRKKIDDV